MESAYEQSERFKREQLGTGGPTADPQRVGGPTGDPQRAGGLEGMAVRILHAGDADGRPAFPQRLFHHSPPRGSTPHETAALSPTAHWAQLR